MPVEMPIAPVGRMYEQEMRPSSYEPPTYLSSLSMPPPAPYPRTLLNPVPGAQTAGGVMPRNLSAPSLMVPSPEDAYMTGVNGIPVSRAPPSANIPVPSSRPTFPSRLGSLSPHYNSPSTSTRRTSSPTTRSVSSRRSSKSSGRRDSYTRFTAEEEAMLMEGVRVFGVGNWKKILNSYRFHWKRTAVDLKDKYRNMTRAKMRRMQVGSASDLSSVGSDDGRMAVSPLSGRVLGGSPLSGGLTASALSTMSSGVTNGVASGMNGVGNGMNGMNGMNGLSAMGSPSSAISNGASSITNGLNGVGSPSSGVTNGVNGMSGFTYSPAEGEMRR